VLPESADTISDGKIRFLWIKRHAPRRAYDLILQRTDGPRVHVTIAMYYH